MTIETLDCLAPFKFDEETQEELATLLQEGIDIPDDLFIEAESQFNG